jgi:hypothetical protein
MDKLRKILKRVRAIARFVYERLKSVFVTRYLITVSFNNIYGDGDDRQFIAKKIISQKEKHLKFRDEDGKTIEYRSSGGLNYIVEDYEYDYEPESK